MNSNSLYISPSSSLYFPFSISPSNFSHYIILWNQNHEKPIHFYFDIWNRNSLIHSKTQTTNDSNNIENSNNSINISDNTNENKVNKGQENSSITPIASIASNTSNTSQMDLKLGHEELSVSELEKKQLESQELQVSQMSQLKIQSQSQLQSDQHLNKNNSKLATLATRSQKNESLIAEKLNQEYFQSRLYHIVNLNGYSGTIGPGECIILCIERKYSEIPSDNYSEKLYMDWNFVEIPNSSMTHLDNLDNLDRDLKNLPIFKKGKVFRQEWTCYFHNIPPSVDLQVTLEYNGFLVSRGDEDVLETLCGKRHFSLNFSPPNFPQYRYPLHELYFHPDNYQLIAPEHVIKKPYEVVCSACKFKLNIQDLQLDQTFPPNATQKIFLCSRCLECPLCGATLIASKFKESIYYYCGYCKWTSSHLKYGSYKGEGFPTLFKIIVEQIQQSPKKIEQKRSSSNILNILLENQKEFVKNITERKVNTPSPRYRPSPVKINEFIKEYESKKIKSASISPNTISLDEMLKNDLKNLLDRQSTEYYNFLPYERRKDSDYTSVNVTDVYPQRKILQPKYKLFHDSDTPFVKDSKDENCDEALFNATHFFPSFLIRYIPVFKLNRESIIILRILNPNDFNVELTLNIEERSNFTTVSSNQDKIHFILPSENQSLLKDLTFTNLNQNILSIQNDSVDLSLQFTPKVATLPVRIELLAKMKVLDTRNISTSFRIFIDLGTIQQ